MKSQLESIFVNLIAELCPSEETDRLSQTPILAAKVWRDLVGNTGSDPAVILRQELIPAGSFQGRVELPKLPFMSLCEHALLPYFGEVEIVFEPALWLAGAGAFEPMVRLCSQRLSLQESLTQQIFEVVQSVLEPKYLRIRIEARHTCMQGRTLVTCCGT